MRGHADGGDREFLRGVLAQHAGFTGSPVAQRVLDAGDEGLTPFVKVMPTDYERVLKVMAQATADGLDEAAMFDRVMEASRG